MSPGELPHRYTGENHRERQKRHGYPQGGASADAGYDCQDQSQHREDEADRHARNIRRGRQRLQGVRVRKLCPVARVRAVYYRESHKRNLGKGGAEHLLSHWCVTFAFDTIPFTPIPDREIKRAALVRLRYERQRPRISMRSSDAGIVSAHQSASAGQ